jgi:hypothetical protein
MTRDACIDGRLVAFAGLGNITVTRDVRFTERHWRIGHVIALVAPSYAARALEPPNISGTPSRPHLALTPPKKNAQNYRRPQDMSGLIRVCSLASRSQGLACSERRGRQRWQTDPPGDFLRSTNGRSRWSWRNRRPKGRGEIFDQSLMQWDICVQSIFTDATH